MQLTDAQRELAARYVPLARSLARRWGDAEAESAAMWGLTTAARDYREPSPIRFATFARRRIRREIATVLRPLKPLLTLPDGHWGQRGAFLVFAHPSAQPHRIAQGKDDAEAILKKLPAKHREVLRLVAIRGLTQTEAGRLLGCSQNQISRLIRQSKTLLAG